MPSDSYIPKHIDDNTGEVLEYLGRPVTEGRQPMKPTDKQKFWELCGLKTTYKDEIQYWYDLGGALIGKGFWEWSPVVDLNNLKLYAFPQLEGYMMFTGEGGIHFIATKNGLNYEAVAEEEEDAIFQAIYEALGGK